MTRKLDICGCLVVQKKRKKCTKLEVYTYLKKTGCWAISFLQMTLLLVFSLCVCVWGGGYLCCVSLTAELQIKKTKKQNTDRKVSAHFGCCQSLIWWDFIFFFFYYSSGCVSLCGCEGDWNHSEIRKKKKKNCYEMKFSSKQGRNCLV